MPELESKCQAYEPEMECECQVNEPELYYCTRQMSGRLGGNVKKGPEKGRIELLELQMEHYWAKLLWSIQGKAAWGRLLQGRVVGLVRHSGITKLRGCGIWLKWKLYRGLLATVVIT